VSGFVIDASVALAWCFDDEATEATRTLLDRFEDDHAEVPALWHLELANALAVGERNKRIVPARSSEFIALVGGLPIVIDEQTPDLALGTILDLARSEGLSAYDASYLELAMRRGMPLATKDNGLAQAARRVGVSLLPTA
jgi:predicted nucleic acid-binding protein